MDFFCKKIEDADYDNVLKKWWNDWNFPAPPKVCLPLNGIMVCDKEGPLYAGYIYFTDSQIVWLEWVVSDKHAPAKRKRGALEYMVKTVSGMIAGKKFLFTSTVLASFKNSLTKCGFKTGDSGIYHLIKEIG